MTILASGCLYMKNPQIHFSDRLTEIDIYQLQHLFNHTAFWAKGRSIEDLSTAVANSKPVISVWDREKLIGFARANSDGIYRATIWDVVIHPDYQGRGLGMRLVRRILSHPLMQVERVYLMTTHQQKFYEKIGFQHNNSTTMVLHNNSKLGSIEQEELQELKYL